MGTSTQQGKMLNVNIHIEQFSTPEDRKVLIDAFAHSGQDGLVDALDHMKAKGRISTPLGPSEKGRHLRLVTNRRIAFGEAYRSTRSEEYSIGAVDLPLTPEDRAQGHCCRHAN